MANPEKGARHRSAKRTLASDANDANSVEMPRPHILFLFTDQQRADCLGCAGHSVLKMPHMDRLAAEGVHFTNCFTTSPLCVPARQTVMTGLYPHNSNMWQNDAETPVDAGTYVGRQGTVPAVSVSIICIAATMEPICTRTSRSSAPSGSTTSSRPAARGATRPALRITPII